MAADWPLTAMRDILSPREETPDLEALAAGQIRIVAKIGFADGKIELRRTGDTRTGMILIRPGDVVISGINAARGAVGYYSGANTEPIAATIHYAAFIPDESRVDPTYLWLFLRSAAFRTVLARELPGGIKTEWKAARLLPLRVPLPSLPEQRRLVARIEELAARVADARRLREEADAFAGALFRSELDRILTFPGTGGTLGQVLMGPPRNGWSARCDNAESGTPVLTLAAVTGFAYRPQAFKRTSLPTREGAHYWLRAGDLLLTRSNTPDLVGHAAIYSGNPPDCVYPDLMMRLDVDEGRALKRFVWYWLQTSMVRNDVRARSRGSSPTMKKLSQAAVQAIPFPAGVSLAEQLRRVERCDRLRRVIEASVQAGQEWKKDADLLLPSILARAFRGEL